MTIRWLVHICLLLCAGAAGAGELLRIPTREGVTTTLFWEETANPRGTVLLFPGGGGGFGRIDDGRPQSGNFLVRSAGHFAEAGYNVAIFGRPTDKAELDYGDRVAEAHITDVSKILTFLKSRSTVPVWFVGTSRGTVSATAAAIRLQGALAGVVLSSSVVSYKKVGAVPRQDLAAIRVPVLVFHHAKDACWVCEPREVPSILRGLTNAPVKRLMMVDGGSNPSGDPCEARHCTATSAWRRERWIR